MSRFDPAILLQCPPHSYVVQRQVRFQDVDAAGIVFFPRILEYLNDALLDYLAARGLEVAQALRDRAWGLPLTHVEADFIAPLRFGDRIDVALVRAAVEPKEVAVGYRVSRHGTDDVVAVGETVHASVDLAAFRRTELPDALRVVFDALPTNPRLE